MELLIVLKMACLIFCLVGCEETLLQCSTISKKPMTRITNIYNCTPIYRSYFDRIECKEEPRDIDEIYREILFTVSKEVPDNGNPNISSYCIGLNHFKSVTKRHTTNSSNERGYTMAFNNTLAIGIFQADADWMKSVSGDLSFYDKGCKSCEMYLLDEIFTERVFSNMTSPPSEPFWDFSSPIFGVEMRWLTHFYHRRVGSFAPRLGKEDLSNTSVRILMLSNQDSQDVFLVKDMPLLYGVAFVESDIRSFHEDNFIGTPEVQYFGIKKCKMKEIPRNIKRMQKLRTLDIWDDNNNENVTVPAEELSTLTHLESIHLYQYKLSSISKTFSTLQSVQNLKLRECQILGTEIDFKNFPSLQHLEVTGSSFDNSQQVHISLPRDLKWVTLSQSNLKKWPVIHGGSIEFLNLAGNSLRYIGNLGQSVTAVKYLDLSYNKVSEWKDDNVFKSRKSSGLWLEQLNISYNKISEFSTIMMDSLNGLQQVDLGGNPWECVNCRMIPFQKWLNTTPIHIINLGTSRPLLCSSPVRNAGGKIVEQSFDEEFCRLRSEIVFVSVGTFMGVVLLLAIIACVVCYKFRSPITYMLHLYTIRRRAMNFHDTDYNNQAFDAFICYSGHDRDFVLRKLAPALEKEPEKYAVCLHERDFPLGRHIIDNIEGCIKHSRKTVILLSEHFIKSKWCTWELEMANHKTFHDDEHFLILIQLEELDRSKLPRHLLFLMDTRTYLDWQFYGQNEEEELYKRLKTALGPSIFQKTQHQAPKFSDCVD